MQKQKIILINGDKAEIKEFADDSLELKTLQNLVGGYIQLVPVSKGFSVIVNEEGLLFDLPKTVFIESVYSGPVIVVKTSSDEIIGLSEADIKNISELITQNII